MAAENCLSKLRELISDPTAEFQVTYQNYWDTVKVNILYFN